LSSDGDSKRFAAESEMQKVKIHIIQLPQKRQFASWKT